MKANDDDKPWVRIYDPWGDPEGSISGNKEGLIELKNKIDQALLGESAPMEEGFDCDFEGVALRESKGEKERAAGFFDKMLGYGCMFIVVICIAIFIFGLTQIWKEFTK